MIEQCECGCHRSQHPRDSACETYNCKCREYAPSCPMCGEKFSDHLGVVGMCRKFHLLKAAVEEIDRVANDSDCEHDVIGVILGLSWRALKDI